MPSYQVLVQPDSTVISKWELLSTVTTMDVVVVAVVVVVVVDIEEAELVVYEVECVGVGVGAAARLSAMVAAEIAGIHGIGFVVVAAVAAELRRDAAIRGAERPAGVPEAL